MVIQDTRKTMSTTGHPVTLETTEPSSTGHDTTQTSVSSKQAVPISHAVTPGSKRVTVSTSTATSTSTSKSTSAPTFSHSTIRSPSPTFHQETTSTTHSPFSWKSPSPTLNQQSTSTTASPFPWKTISFGLMGGVALFLFVSIVLVIVVCKLKRRLKKAHVTLYPVAKADDHTYTPLKPPAKPGLSVEMSPVTKVEHIEEVDSPVFSEPHPPPLFPKNISHPSSDDSPEPDVPMRRPKNLASKQSSDSEALVSKASKRASGLENSAFTNGNENTDIDDCYDEDPYESYDASLYKNHRFSGIPDGLPSDNIADDGLLYETPVTSNKSKTETDRESIKRQSSSSGLPDFVFSLNEAVEMTQVTNVNDEEEFDSPGFSEPTPPPLLPKSLSKSSLDKPPELPTRRQKGPTPTRAEKMSAAKEDQPQSTETSKTRVDVVRQQAPLRENPIFTNDISTDGIAASYVEGEKATNDEEQLYESYDDSRYHNQIMSGVPDEDVKMDDVLAYEVPAIATKGKISTESEVSHQSSFSSRLPDIAFNINGSVHDNDEARVDSDEDIYHNEEVEQKLDGLPVSNGFPDINDLATYDYVDNPDIVLSHTTGDKPNVSNINGHGESQQDDSVNNDVPGAHTYLILDKAECISERVNNQEDNAVDIVHGSENLNSNYIKDTSSEIGLTNATINTDRTSVTPFENKNETPLRDNPNDKENDIVPPKVPRRRDLEERSLGLSMNHNNKKDVKFTLDSEEEDDESLNSTQAMVGEVEMRRGKRVSDISNTFSVENSYFLDMEDGSKEMSERQQKRISVHKMSDNEMPLSELLHMYVDEKIKVCDDSGDDSGVQTEIKVDTNQMQATDISGDVNAIKPHANGIVKSGSLLDDSDEFQMDDTLCDILAPVRRDESMA